MKTLLKLAAAAAAWGVAGAAHSQGNAPIKVGLMLPYTGTYAALGNAIENGFKLYVQEHGGKLAGREIQYFKVDDESEPSQEAAGGADAFEAQLDLGFEVGGRGRHALVSVAQLV